MSDDVTTCPQCGQTLIVPPGAEPTLVQAGCSCVVVVSERDEDEASDEVPRETSQHARMRTPLDGQQSLDERAHFQPLDA